MLYITVSYQLGFYNETLSQTNKNIQYSNNALWHTSKIPALRRPREKDLQFEASLRYLARLCFKTNKTRKVVSLPRLQTKAK